MQQTCNRRATNDATDMADNEARDAAEDAANDTASQNEKRPRLSVNPTILVAEDSGTETSNLVNASTPAG